MQLSMGFDENFLSAVVVVNTLKLVCGFVGFTARLLIRGFQSVLDYLICSLGTWCVWVLFIMLMLLSAVVGIMAQLVACGVGISRSFLVRMVLSVLDYLV